MLLFELNKKDIDLSASEVLALTGGKSIEDKGLLVVNSKFSSRLMLLAFTKTIHKILFSCQKKELTQRIERFDWNREYSDNFRLVAHDSLDEKRLAGIIYSRLKKPKVKLKGPKTEFHIFSREKVYITKKIWEQSEDFHSRTATSWPEFHPTSLDPRLARAMINLTGIRSGVIVDPCCGAGGFLMEAARMGFSPKGYDIDRIMINRARINLEHFNLKARLKQRDSLTLKRKARYIVSDLPYSRNTKKVSSDFYKRFFEMLNRVLIKKAVIGIPKGIPYESFIGELKIKKEFIYALHRTLSKKIIVISV